MNPPADPADQHAELHAPVDEAVAAGQPDTAVQPAEQPDATLPTMADLDRLSVALDDIDDTLDNLDRRG